MYTSRLQEVKARLEGILQEKQEKGEILAGLEAEYDEEDYQGALLALEEQLAEIPTETAMRLAEQQGIQPSSVFKAIGQAADLALLLLPGDVIVSGIKAVADTTKIAQGLHKMGKVGEIIVKAGSAVGGNAKVIDRARDAAYAVNSVFKKRGYSTKAEKRAAEKLVDATAKKAGEAFGD